MPLEKDPGLGKPLTLSMGNPQIWPQTMRLGQTAWMMGLSWPRRLGPDLENREIRAEPDRAHPSIPVRATWTRAGTETPAAITPSLPCKPPPGQHQFGNFLSTSVSEDTRAERCCSPCFRAGMGTARHRRCHGALCSPWVTARPSHTASPLQTRPTEPSPGLPLPLCSQPISQLLNLIGEGQLEVCYLRLLLIVFQIPPGRNINQNKIITTTTTITLLFSSLLLLSSFKK